MTPRAAHLPSPLRGNPAAVLAQIAKAKRAAAPLTTLQVYAAESALPLLPKIQ